MTDGPWPYWEILPGQLYQRARLHKYEEIDKRLWLVERNITHVYAMAPTKPDPHLGELSTYWHYPIPDGRLVSNTQTELLQRASEACRVIDQGTAVMTMCNAGRNRSGLLSALIVREYTGVPGSVAMDIVRHHRPNALANDYFAEWLETLP